MLNRTETSLDYTGPAELLNGHVCLPINGSKTPLRLDELVAALFGERKHLDELRIEIRNLDA